LLASVEKVLDLSVAVQVEVVSLPLFLAHDVDYATLLKEEGPALNERLLALMDLVAKYLPKFRHVRFYIPAKIPEEAQQMCIKMVRSYLLK
jgi:hypothetical protein